MNILFILNTVIPQRGGVSMVTYIISQKMKEHNHKVFYLYNHFDSFQDYGTSQYYLPATANKELTYRMLIDICKNNNIDIIINQTGPSKKIILSLKRIKSNLSNIAIYTFYHSSPDFWKKQLTPPPFHLFNTKIFITNLLKRILYTFYNNNKKNTEMLYSISDKFILLSQTFIPEFIKTYNIGKGEKLDFINNPCTLYKQESNNVSPKKNQVLVVGRLSEKQKRISIIIRIWKDIEKKHKDWELILVGNGPDKKNYEMLARKYKLTNIRFMGQQSNTGAFYKEAKIFMMTSIWEGWGLTLVEALYYQCVPILFDNFSACHDIITNEKNGILIPNNNRKIFTEKLDQLINDQTKLNNLSRECWKSIQKFNIDNIYSKWEEKILS